MGGRPRNLQARVHGGRAPALRPVCTRCPPCAHVAFRLPGYDLQIYRRTFSRGKMAAPAPDAPAAHAWGVGCVTRAGEPGSEREPSVFTMHWWAGMRGLRGRTVAESHGVRQSIIENTLGLKWNFLQNSFFINVYKIGIKYF